jgi:uncharacterized membrane protein
VPETDTASSVLPVHIEETIQSIAGLNAEHRANATHHQRFVDRITSLLGRASFIAALTAFVVGWVSLNSFAVALGYRALDPPPFAWLAGASCLTSLFGHTDPHHAERRRSPYPAPRTAQSGADDLERTKNRQGGRTA